ncbi:MAG: acyltransferase family protein [Clostridiaceae bacterium]|nr:acyltransferase family protein [Clostridiaceae bacterium]
MSEGSIKSERERVPYWDNIKGILILLVVFGHFIWGYMGTGLAGVILSFIYIFHMPAFVFVSGFLSKSEHSRSKQSLIKLALIYILFNTTIMIVSVAVFGSSFQLLTPSYSFWFLLSLIIWRAVEKYIPQSNLFIIVCVAAAILIGFWKDVTNVLAIARTIAFFPFFHIGYKLPAEKTRHLIYHRKPKIYIIGILSLLYAALLSVLFLNRNPWLGETDFLMNSYSSVTDAITRITLLCLAGLVTAALVLLAPVKPIPLLCKWGKNSLSIYVLHRFITFAYAKSFPAATYSDYYIIYAFGAAFITTLVLGSDMVAGKFNQFINKAMQFFAFNELYAKKKTKRVAAIVSLLLLFLMLPMLPKIQPARKATVQANLSQQNFDDVIHSVITSEQEAALKDAVTIAFVGDLILLQDQVRNAYQDSTGEYDFTPMFAYTKDYLTEADLAIGIFEGPMAGEEVGYSTSNFGDGIPLYLNYPDAFAYAVKESGIDLVSTANNHLLDKGEEGAMRTLDVLDQVGLMHVGSWRNSSEKASVPVIEVRGIRIAFFAYTYGSNYYKGEYFLRENPSLTSILADPSDEYFEEVKMMVLNDFQRIREMENPPDKIVVIPHMGTQFSHETDLYQDTWNNIFVEAGADIILGDHAHAVQPIEFRRATDKAGKEKLTVIVNCPGNFANSYTEKNGDATAIVEIFLDPIDKKIICAGVVPMYTQCPINGNYRALPIYSIVNDHVLQGEISRYEFERVEQVVNTVTSVMLGTPLTIDQIQERHYLFPEGYVRQEVCPIKITEDMRNTVLFGLLSEAKSVCFVGDSLTEGTKNGGYGWYEPLVAAFPDLIVYKQAWGGGTTRTLIDNTKTILANNAQLYVIAIGTNDIRYRDEQICAMDKESYIKNIDTLIGKILDGNPEAKFVFISPWLAQANDPYTRVSIEERDEMLHEYGEALRSYCIMNGHLYINPNPSLKALLTKYQPSDYLLDHIHPNAGKGIALYSEKVLEASQ